ncbi:MAG: efflux RND transporter periplasmic adaptor subunit [Thermodesulfobacteriota bacterium]
MNKIALKQNPEPLRQAEGQSAQAGNPLLARLVNLSISALKAESFEKRTTLIVNQIHTLVKTERTLLAPLSGKNRILCISGDLEPSQDNPFSQAVAEIRSIYRNVDEAKVISGESLDSDIRAPQTRKVLEAMGGTQILWLPLPSPASDEKSFALWLERWNNKPWNPEEIKLLSHAAYLFGSALAVPRKVKKKSGKKRGLLVGLIVLALLLMVPVHSRVTAPAQVVPDNPYYVFAPFDGIVDDLTVKPGEKVAKGNLIFRYDTRVLEKQLEEAQRGGLAVARAELSRLEGEAYKNEEARAKIPVQKLEVKRKQSEVEFLQTQLELSEVRTEADGVVVLDDPDALIGASLQTGQLVLSVADPERTKLKIMVPVTDAGLLQEDAPAGIRLDSAPLRSIDAKIERIGFDVVLSDERVPSVLVEAVWEKKVLLNPGQRGIARIKGPKIALGLQLFRKPLMVVRTFLGI